MDTTTAFANAFPVNPNGTHYMFLFAYIYSLPFALLSVISKPVQNVVVVFIASYGFIGIEHCSIQLDDPFGDDPIDLPVRGQTKSVTKDVYLALLDSDGMEAVNAVKANMKPTPSWQKKKTSSKNSASWNNNETTTLWLHRFRARSIVAKSKYCVLCYQPKWKKDQTY